MEGNRIRGSVGGRGMAWLVVFCFLLAAEHVCAQPVDGANASIPVLMVSDIHFEPFADPGKVARLAGAPASQWKAILAGPASPARAERFAALQKSCHAKGVDTSYTLFASSLGAMRGDAAGAQFILLSGDLMSHKFSCKYAALFPNATEASYREFAVKTVDFVMDELRGALPGVPVYAALGNNDSGCEDYKLDPNGAFLADLAPTVTADVPEPERAQALKDFAAGGYYSVSLPAPMEHTRLLTIDDVFMSKKYETCGGKPDPAAAAAQIAWLKEQLEKAQSEHERVWVMSHIPPGVDPYSTISKFRNVCAGQKPEMFLSSEALPDAMAEFGDTIKLAIFAHTHMDELRLLEPASPGGDAGPVALKIVPSITPVDGNNPSFVVARVDPATAAMTDYEVIAASNQTGPNQTGPNQAGVDMKCGEEYDFDKTYDETGFTAASLEKLVAGFRADPGARTAASESYLRDYFVGDESRLLTPFWGEYVCALGNDTEAGFKECTCAGNK